MCHGWAGNAGAWCLFLEIGNLAGLQLKLQFVGDKGDKFRSEESAAAIEKGIARKMPSEKW
jgi:hypothetical protein